MDDFAVEMLPPSFFIGKALRNSRRGKLLGDSILQTSKAFRIERASLFWHSSFGTRCGSYAVIITSPSSALKYFIWSWLYPPWNSLEHTLLSKINVSLASCQFPNFWKFRIFGVTWSYCRHMALGQLCRKNVLIIHFQSLLKSKTLPLLSQQRRQAKIEDVRKKMRAQFRVHPTCYAWWNFRKENTQWP